MRLSVRGCPPSRGWGSDHPAGSVARGLAEGEWKILPQNHGFRKRWCLGPSPDNRKSGTSIVTFPSILVPGQSLYGRASHFLESYGIRPGRVSRHRDQHVQIA